MDVSLPQRVEVPSHVLYQELEGEAVLLNLQTERYFGLDDVGTRMWQLLSEQGDVAAAFEQLQAEYAVEADRLRQDLAQLINRLAEAGLLTVAPPATPADASG
jgi:hypothetical protein